MQVVVLGAGYAGVVVTRRLERALPTGVSLTVVDAADHHLLAHELHRVVRRPAIADAITLPFDSLFDRARFVRGEVVDVDDRAGVATLADGTELDFDLAAVCLGAETDYHDLPGVEEHATPLKRLGDAEAIRERFLDLVGRADGRAVVGGAGLSGVQVAGELAALADERGAAVEVVLLEQADTVAPGFPAHFSTAVEDALGEQGVDVRTDTAVGGVTASEVELDDGALSYDQLVWTGGIRGPSALGEDRPVVRATLRSGERTFVVGDAARVVDRDGKELPATAQAATAEARTAARNIDTLVRYARDGGTFEPRLEPVDFTSRGWIVSVGTRAVAQVGPLILRDRAAQALKASIGVSYLGRVGAVGKALDLVREELKAG